MKNKKKIFTQVILNHWKNNQREFPWRNTNDPYVILITEVLLRKTTASHVNSIHHEFFKKYPSIYALANSNIRDLKKLIKPLGLSNQRSEQLIKLAKIIVSNYGGEIPTNFLELVKLPGVGRYTSSGVMCNAFKKDYAMVDNNVVKIVSRYFGYEFQKNPPYTDPQLWEFVESLIPKGKCREFNLGLIDFVSEICKTKKPRCKICKLKNQCIFLNDLV